MEIRNMPTNWSIPMVIVGHGFSTEQLHDLMKRIKEALEKGESVAIADMSNSLVDASIEFFPLLGDYNDIKADFEAMKQLCLQ